MFNIRHFVNIYEIPRFRLPFFVVKRENYFILIERRITARVPFSFLGMRTMMVLMTI
jgi:hypothetical protein